jgi:hypothetical protein
VVYFKIYAEIEPMVCKCVLNNSLFVVKLVFLPFIIVLILCKTR